MKPLLAVVAYGGADEPPRLSRAEMHMIKWGCC
jgi:hypothetical protein